VGYVARATLNGSYPRYPGVARLYSRLASGKLSEDGFGREILKYVRKLFTQLKASGVEFFTDGMFRWDDIFNPLIRFVRGVEVDGLTRFYDNNFFFRSPVVRGRLGLREGCPIPTWFRESLRVATEVFGDGSTLKQPLPGPITLATNSVDEFYRDPATLVHEWGSEVLEPLINELVRAGCRVVELHEPSLTWGGVKQAVLSSGVKVLVKIIESVKADVWVLTYFKPVSRFRRYFSELSRAVIGVDLAANRGRGYLRLIKECGVGRVMLGAVDSRNTLMEGVKEVVREVRAALRAGATEVYVGNNAPMDFIPEVVASRKVKLLGRVARYLRGG